MKNSNIKQAQETIYARPTKRVLGFFIDYMIITFIRTLVLQICMYLFLAKHILSFFEVTYQTFGKTTTFETFNENYLSLFLRHSIFIEIILILCLIVLIAPIYNVLLIKSKIKTTLGKRIFKVYPQVIDGSEPSGLRIICHYFISLIPIILAIGFITLEMLRYYNIIGLQYSNLTIALVLFAFVSWYDLAFVTKKRVMVHDLICGIVFVSGDKKEKEKSTFSLNRFLEEQIRKARQSLSDAKEKAQESKAKFKETIKEAPKKAKAKKAKIKKKISAKKSTPKKTKVKKKSSAKKHK